MFVKIFLICLVSLLIYMSLWFLVARSRQRLDVVDTAWGGGFILVALISALRLTARSELICVLVLVWGVRLAVHIWRRNSFKGPDPRYEELSDKWPKRHFWLRAYLSVFLIQGLLILVIALPVIVSATETSPLPYWHAILGTLLWYTGFAVESAADKQLSDFISKPASKGKVLQTGLWRYSRHPNYFGELLMWWSIGILALGGRWSWVGLIGPLVLTYLIVFVSGIPVIEKRRQKNPDYQAYQMRTSPLIPLPRR